MMEQFISLTDEIIEYNLVHLPQLVFEVTDACNLRCKYCGYAELYEGYDKRENQKLSFQKVKHVIEYLFALWEKYYSEGVTEAINIGFYGGEPLLNVPFIKQVIYYIENQPFVGKKFFYSMTTNATLLDKYMDFLVEKEFRLLISLDGDKEAQSYRVDAKGQNSFDQVFANINLLRQQYPDYFKRLVHFNSVLHRNNSVKGILHFIKEAFGKDARISPLNNSRIRKDKIDEFNKIYRNYNESVLQTHNCESFKAEIFIKNPETYTLLNYIYYQSGNVFFSYNELLAKKSIISVGLPGTCTPFLKKMFVTTKGRILQCERINHEFSLGEVTDTSFELDLKKIAKRHNDYIRKFVNKCEKCGDKNACTQCVYQIDNINSVNTKCPSFCTGPQKKSRDEQSLKYLTEHPELYTRLLNEVVIRG